MKPGATARSGCSARAAVACVVKSVSLVENFCTVTRSSPMDLTVSWNVPVSDLLKASSCAKNTATFLMSGLSFSAALTAFRRTMATGAETRAT